MRLLEIAATGSQHSMASGYFSIQKYAANLNISTKEFFTA